MRYKVFSERGREVSLVPFKILIYSPDILHFLLYLLAAQFKISCRGSKRSSRDKK